MRARAWLRVAQYGFLVAGLAAIGYCVWSWIDARRFQAAEQRRFDAELRNLPPARAEIPTPLLIPREGASMGRIEIPRIGVSVMVVEGVGHDDLSRAVGHVPGTALPGQPGNVALAGHRDTFFRPLRLIRANDEITLTTLGGSYRYRVVSTSVVTPEDVQVLSPTRRDTLTLVTCFPFYYVGAAPKRFIVRARRLTESASARASTDASAGLE